MKAIVKRWGNSLGVRFAKPIVQDSNLEEGSEVNIRTRNGNIIIEPVKKKSYRLDELLEGITPQNIHKEIETDRPVGGEVW